MCLIPGSGDNEQIAEYKYNVHVTINNVRNTLVLRKTSNKAKMLTRNMFIFLTLRKVRGPYGVDLVIE